MAAARKLKVVAPPPPPVPTRMEKFMEALGLMVLQVVVYAVVIICALGYIRNIVFIAQGFNGPITVEMAARMVGVPIFPLGILLGFIP